MSNDFYVWNSFEILKILHENNSLSNLHSHSHILEPELNAWGHDQAGGKSKTLGRAGSIILFLRKMLVKIGNS
jgi:hypothetical protein